MVALRLLGGSSPSVDPSAGLAPEGPGDHIRNALQLLVGHEAAHPAVWEFSGELRAVEALLFKALYGLATTGQGR
jgi:hypothetical protein